MMTVTVASPPRLLAISIGFKTASVYVSQPSIITIEINVFIVDRQNEISILLAYIHYILRHRW